MSEEVTRRQHALEYQAMHDHLTGLPNRFSLNQRIEYQLLAAERQEKPFALFLMDLNHFKDINDTLGHAAGDNLLIEVSTRIQALIRKSDTLARLGGDEFSILLPDSDSQSAIALAEKIISVLCQPFTIKDQTITIGISIGIVNYPKDGLNSPLLLQHADMAMYSAKRKRIGYSHYESNEDVYSRERLSLFNEVQLALDNQQFEVHFQPKITVQTGEICGAEALLRWRNDKFGNIPADKIIEAAERVGIIHRITLWVLEQGISTCARWHQNGCPISLSVNLSVRDLSNQQLCDQIYALMQTYNLDFRYLTLEITEGVMMENLALSLEVLERLHKMGINLSIDDFGTGFSSLAYLKKLPVNELKIDKSFIMEMDRDMNDRLIVQSTINLGHNLGLMVIAEGVENEHIMQLVRDLGCDQAQGYHLGKPQPSIEFNQVLNEALLKSA